MTWWRGAVVYQVYVRSFADSDGDGVGDLDGVRSRLGYLELLGVDALWLTPFHISPMADHGDLDAFDRLVVAAHEHGLRVLVDLVPDHTSDQHECEQPDLEKTLRFWLDRGVDGFRIDVAHGMSKPDGVHAVHRMIRAVVDHYPGRVTVGEISPPDATRFARYLRPDELHLGLHSRLLHVPFEATAVREAVEHTMTAVAAVSAAPAWAVSSHDVSRPVTRYGGGELGTWRTRALALLTLALPGTVVVPCGDELGLPDVDLPDEVLQDPVWERSGRTERGRDAFRVPVPWEGGPPGYGFTTGVPWLPMPPEYGRLTVAEQLEDTGSSLSLLRRAIELRRTHPGFAGSELEWFGAPTGCLAFRRAGSTLVCALNASTEAVPLPPGDVLLSSVPLDDDLLPPDTAAWLA